MHHLQLANYPSTESIGAAFFEVGGPFAPSGRQSVASAKCSTKWKNTRVAVQEKTHHPMVSVCQNFPTSASTMISHPVGNALRQPCEWLMNISDDGLYKSARLGR